MIRVMALLAACALLSQAATSADARTGTERSGPDSPVSRDAGVLIGATLLASGGVLLLVDQELGHQAEATASALAWIAAATPDYQGRTPDKKSLYGGNMKKVGYVLLGAGFVGVLVGGSHGRTDRIDAVAGMQSTCRTPHAWRLEVAPRGLDGVQARLTHRF